MRITGGGDLDLLLFDVLPSDSFVEATGEPLCRYSWSPKGVLPGLQIDEPPLPAEVRLTSAQVLASRYARVVGFTVTFPTTQDVPDRTVVSEWLRQRGEPFSEHDGGVRLRAVEVVLTFGEKLSADLDISSSVDLTRVVDLVFELSILVGADVRLQGVGDVRRGRLWLQLADEQDRLRLGEALDRAELLGRREEVSQRLWQIVSAIRPGRDDRWDANNHRIIELQEVGAPDGISLADAGWLSDDPQAGDLLAVPIETWVHSLAWRWLSEAYPGLAEAEHTFH